MSACVQSERQVKKLVKSIVRMKTSAVGTEQWGRSPSSPGWAGAGRGPSAEPTAALSPGSGPGRAVRGTRARLGRRGPGDPRGTPGRQLAMQVRPGGTRWGVVSIGGPGGRVVGEALSWGHRQPCLHRALNQRARFPFGRVGKD